MDFNIKIMNTKNLLFTIVLTLLSIASNAQSNLEFDQVFNRFYPYPNSVSYETHQVVVPPGKVLKITSATVLPKFNAAETSIGISNVAFMINGHLLAYYEATSYTTPTFNKVINNSPFPFWLGEGTHTVQLIMQYPTVWTPNYGCSFSGILFNLTQD